MGYILEDRYLRSELISKIKKCKNISIKDKCSIVEHQINPGCVVSKLSNGETIKSTLIIAVTVKTVKQLNLQILIVSVGAITKCHLCVQLSMKKHIMGVHINFLDRLGQLQFSHYQRPLIHCLD